MTAAQHQTLFTVAQLVSAEPALTKGGVRNDLFNRETNGLEASGAVIYRGRRILIHKARYMDWTESRVKCQKAGFASLTSKDIKKRMIDSSMDQEDRGYSGEMSEDMRWHQ